MTLADTLFLDTVTVALHGLCLHSTVPSGHDPCGRLTLSAAVSEERKKEEAQFEVAIGFEHYRYGCFSVARV